MSACNVSKKLKKPELKVKVVRREERKAYFAIKDFETLPETKMIKIKWTVNFMKMSKEEFVSDMRF